MDDPNKKAIRKFDFKRILEFQAGKRNSIEN